jgi:hypothetical protein
VTDIAAELGVHLTPILDALGPVLEAMEWAEEEITTAQIENPEAAVRLHASFLLLRPTHDRMQTEMVFRAHCRELLRRVVREEDTRPGTAAECCAALSETSKIAPMRTSAAGLYARMWKLAELPPTDLTGAGEHYEALEGSQIDEHEGWLRTKLRQVWRVLGSEDA